jgi:hypothetical protein
MSRIEDEITDKIKGLFDSYDEKPDTLLWSRLESQLKKDRQRKKMVWLWFDAAAIVLLSLGLMQSIYFVDNDSQLYSDHASLKKGSIQDSTITRLRVSGIDQMTDKLPQSDEDATSSITDHLLKANEASSIVINKQSKSRVQLHQLSRISAIYSANDIGTQDPISQLIHHPASIDEVEEILLTSIPLGAVSPLELSPIKDIQSVNESNKVSFDFMEIQHQNITKSNRSFRLGWYIGAAALSPAMAEFAGAQVQAGALGSVRINSRIFIDLGIGLNWGKVYKDANPYANKLSDVVFPDQTQEFFTLGSYVDRYQAGIWAIELPLQANYEWGKKRRQRMSLGVVSQIILSEDAEIRNLELRGIPENMASTSTNFRIEERFYTIKSAIKSGTHQEWLAYMRLAYGIQLKAGNHPLWLEPFAQWSIQGVTTQSARMASAGFRICGVI